MIIDCVSGKNVKNLTEAKLSVKRKPLLYRQQGLFGWL